MPVKENELLKVAKKYRDVCGFSVIPLLKNKKPALKWEEYQHKRATDAELEAWFSNNGNEFMIGIVTGDISGITVIDMDNDDAKALVDRTLYTRGQERFIIAKTPRGYHYYFRYAYSMRNTANIMPGVDIRGDGGYVVAPPSVNINGTSYLWVQMEWKKAKEHYPVFPSKIFGSIEPEEEPEYENIEMFVQGRRDEDLFHIANTLVKGGMEVSEIYQVIHKLAVSCKPPYPNSDVAIKVKSAVERGLRKERNLTQEVKQWVASNSGSFSITDVSRTLQLFTKEDLATLYTILNRLKKAGIVEKYGTKAGVFRRIERDYMEMDWLNAVVQPLNINYPLALHNVCDTYPKNVVVIAGIKDSGKTAFFLDFIKRNQRNYNIHYFTNEMGDEELKLRLTAHKDMKPEEWKFRAYEVGGAWADIVQPNDITIVDYIEVNDAFYQIGDIIKQMHEKLDKGILLIGMQKARGKLLGRGAEFSLQRPRLYVSLDSGLATIVSAKNRKANLHVNPVGFICGYDIIDGWQIKPTSKWHAPGDKDAKKDQE